jgi:hypothetical protein
LETKKRIAVTVILCCLFAAVLQAAPITVAAYGPFAGNGNIDPQTASFGGVPQIEGANDINFGPNWMPFGLVSSSTTWWGAVISGTLYAPSAGSYPISITSDDSAALNINGGVFDDWLLLAAHAPETTAYSVPLEAGANPFTIRYIEWNGLPAQLTMDIGNLHYTPEPATYGLIGAGLFAIGALARRRKTS